MTDTAELRIELLNHANTLYAKLIEEGDVDQIKLLAKELKADLKSHSELHHSIDEAYLHMPNLSSNPYNTRKPWSFALYDVLIDLKHEIKPNN